MRRLWRSLFARRPVPAISLDEVKHWRAEFAKLGADDLKSTDWRSRSLPEVVGLTAVVASRVLGLEMFDEQLQGALALAGGAVVEMQTGEGKTLAAVPAIAWHARTGEGVHVLTANDYLARRDAAWMGPVFAAMGISVAAVQQTDAPDVRRAAYRADVTYATANEVGFDYLRDSLALSVAERVHRPFHTAVVDEADSMLIDEARIPLVIAGGREAATVAASDADRAVRRLRAGIDFAVEPAGRTVLLTAAGVTAVERTLGRANLFDEHHLTLLTAIQDALHAHVLLRRDVDYLVQAGAVVPVDEFKGRLVHDRRWPAGLQTALEIKEGMLAQVQGRVLGSITLEHLMSLYPSVCGMTGTAATQAEEFREIYGLEVHILPTHRPVVRVDHADRVFATRAEKEAAVVEEVGRVHAEGRPVLVGTSSVLESERLSRTLGMPGGRPHVVLNARHEEAEAAIIARAGEAGAITISTNMAGRGVDIRLGPGVAERGGLHVIGTNRHESRRIDHQLRGRAGRQGDPGSSQFFVSSEDALMTKYGGDSSIDPDAVQRVAEGQNLDIRLFLRKYELVLEGQRRAIQERREAALADTGDQDAVRRVTLSTVDELWSDYLAAVAELRAGTVWVSLGGGQPFSEYLRQLHAMFEELQRTITEEVEVRRADPAAFAAAFERGATWTYLTTDEPFGAMTTRVMRGLVRMIRRQGKKAVALDAE